MFLFICATPPALAHGRETPETYGKPCPFDHPDWRKAQTIAGVAMEADRSCAPDNPDVIAAVVKGTNNVPPAVLMASGLAPDAVVKTDDRDGDGDPDVIHIRLEIIGLNEGRNPQLTYEIAPGIKPAFWTFAPKTTGMVTEDSYASYLMRMPAPAIRVEQGDTVYVTVENTHYLPHTIHFHGVDHPYLQPSGKGNDGVPLTSEKPILPGEQRTYEFTPRTTGTMFYHCHVQPNIHVLMGLEGMFIIEPNRPNNTVQTLNPGDGKVRYRSQSSREKYNGEFDLQYQGVDKELHDIPKLSDDPRVIAKMTNREYNVTHRVPEYFLLNGESFPYTLRDSQIIVRPDRRYLLRILNGGSETISLHTHGHKFKVLAYDGVELAPDQQYYRDVLGLTAAQRADVELNTTDDGLHSYGPGVWLFHNHREAAVTTDGIFPGGDISLITYTRFLDGNGMPRTQGMQLSRYFKPDYYRKKVPVWQNLEPELLGEPQTEDPWRTFSLALVVLLAGVGVGLLLRLLYRRRRSGLGVIALGFFLAGGMAGTPVPAQAMQGTRRDQDLHGTAASGVQGRGGTVAMRIRRGKNSMVMNEDKDRLPPGCNAVSEDRRITVRAGTRFAKRFPGTMYTYDTQSIHTKPCTRLTVTFENDDHIRHQFMVHDLPESVYPLGTFTIEVTGPGSETGTFITPAQSETLLVHCGVPQHEEKGMKAEIINGSGDGDLPNIPGITRAAPGHILHLPRLLAAAGIVGLCLGLLIPFSRRRDDH